MKAGEPTRYSDTSKGELTRVSDSEKIASARVARRVTQLRHRAGFDLTNALTRQVEVFADLFKGAGLATIETEAKLQDLAFTFVERRQQPADLIREQRSGGDLEGGIG